MIKYEKEITKMRNIQKDLEAYEARFGNTKSGINTFVLDDIRVIVSKNLKGKKAYVSDGFDWYGMVMDALKIGYLMGYRKAERTINTKRTGEAKQCKDNG